MNLSELEPREIDGYRAGRMESYDLTEEQWREWVRTDATQVARSERGKPFVRISTHVVEVNGELVFVTEWSEKLGRREFDSAAEAMAHHEELAKPITERLDVVLGHGVQTLAKGAL